MTDEDWGMLSGCEAIGRLGDTAGDYQVIDYDASQTEYSGYTHAAHAMIYAIDERQLWKLYDTRAAILMQMRFDGVIGFPGGIVDPGEDPVHGVNRELHEEIGLDLEKYRMKQENHARTYLHEKKKLILHFFVNAVALQDFKHIEKMNLSAEEYGVETLGVMRPPLFTMGDGFRGLPAFLANQFAGNAREELLLGAENAGILTKEEIIKALAACQTIKSNSTS